MTATLPPRTGRAYRGVVYGIDVIDHDAWMAGTPVIVANDYIGQTRQKGRLRENQHRDTQPFSDAIVGSPRVLWEGVCTDDELDAVEQRLIREGVGGVRPRLNVEHNEDNPHRIPKFRQQEQRRVREPDWVPYEQRPRQSLLEWETPVSTQTRPVQRKRSTRKWSTRQRRAVVWSISWLVLQVVSWVALARYGRWPTTTDALCACLISATLLLWWAFGKEPRRWRRRWRRALR